MRPSLVIVATLLLSGPGVAAAVEPYTCRNGLFTDRIEAITAGRIIEAAGARVHFRSDDDGCPDAATCVRKAYLVPGDRVLISKRESGWSCVWYFGKREVTVGWLPTGTVAHAPSVDPALDEWIGTWRPIAGDNEIVIRRDRSGRGGAVSGTATWYGGRLEDGSEIVHVGEFEGEGRPDGDRWTVGESAEAYACMVDMRFVAGQLVVHDNANCGGLNVRFDDIYRKAPPAPAARPKGR